MDTNRIIRIKNELAALSPTERAFLDGMSFNGSTETLATPKRTRRTKASAGKVVVKPAKARRTPAAAKVKAPRKAKAAAPVVGSDAVERVFDAITADGIRPKGIMTATGLDLPRVRAALSQLKGEKRIIATDRGAHPNYVPAAK